MDTVDHPIVFFDGYCGMCSRWVDFLIKRDKKRLFRYSPLQGETAKDRFKGKSEEELLRSVWLQDADGLHDRSTAVFRMVRLLPQPWPLLGVLMLIPRPVRDWAYGVCAKNRYRMFPRTEICRVPTAEERAYFLP